MFCGMASVALATGGQASPVSSQERIEAVVSGQWTAGMDDDAGKAAATSSTDLPAADFTGMRHIYPKRERLFTTSLDGTWAFKLVKGLAVPDELKGWNELGYDTREWNDIQVPGNWETQGLKSPQYGNQIDEMSGLYVRNFRWNYRWEGQRLQHGAVGCNRQARQGTQHDCRKGYYPLARLAFRHQRLLGARGNLQKRGIVYG